MYLVEIIVGKFLAFMAPLNARTRHKRTDLMPICDDLWYERRDLLLVGHVCDVDPCLASKLLNFFLGSRT